MPHFEKMLYDNAQIVDILTLVWQHNRAPLYRERVAETLGWALREMRVEEAFASSLDADTDGEEGKYYLWSEAEIDAALQGTFAQRFKEIYSVAREGNFQGKYILHRLGNRAALSAGRCRRSHAGQAARPVARPRARSAPRRRATTRSWPTGTA